MFLNKDLPELHQKKKIYICVEDLNISYTTSILFIIEPCVNKKSLMLLRITDRYCLNIICRISKAAEVRSTDRLAIKK